MNIKLLGKVQKNSKNYYKNVANIKYYLSNLY